MGKDTPDMKPKKAGRAILISEKMNFKAQRVTLYIDQKEQQSKQI